MKHALPFAALGLVALIGLLRAPAAEAVAPQVGPTVLNTDTGSVRVDARLESTRLLAGSDVETYARVVLEGKEAPAQQERLPLSLTVVIDQSGSMGGDKILSARASAVQVLDQLAPGDKVSVISFSDGARVLVPSLTAGVDDMRSAKRAIHDLRATGGTDMVAGLVKAQERALALYGEGRVNRVLLLSDGQPNTEQGLKELVSGLAKRGVATTTLGVGRDYNEDLMAKLADAGLGNYWFIESAAQMAQIFNKELETLAAVVAKEAVVTVSTRRGVEVLDVFGYEISRGKDLVAVPVGDVYGGKKAEILVRLKVRGAAEGADKELIDVKVSFHDALENKARRVARPLVASFTRDAAAVQASMDLDVVRKAEEVRTALALERASEAVSRGDREEARRISMDQKQRVRSFAAAAGTAYAPAAAEMASALDELEDAAEGKADVAVASKKAKAAARSMRR